jgi:Peptidase family M3
VHVSQRRDWLRGWRPLALSLLVGGTGPCGAAAAATPAGLPALESAYADFNDAQGAVSLIDSDPVRFQDLAYAGSSRAQWQDTYVTRRAQLVAGLPAVTRAGLSVQDVRAIDVMQAAVADSTATPESLAPAGHCSDAQRQDQALEPLQAALYACFAELANDLKFDDGSVTRVAAFEMLTHMQEAPRRRDLFMAFVPLWQALDGDDGPSSPYRRMIRMAAAAGRKNGSPVDAAARTVGISTVQVEHWLVRILDTWRQVSGNTEVEPWDYRFAGGAAERELGEAVPRADLQGLNQRYYQDLGLDLAGSQVMYDLVPRKGKAPLAYTDYVRRGRMEEGHWRATLVRVSASYGSGGLGPLNELVHENGHAAHMLALRTRPAFMDLGDAIFYEAFADVPAWNVYEPKWQQHYLGRSAGQSQSLRALFSNVMLDVAWALFDTRMLAHPQSDPNAVWTEITHRYLHVKPHPELAWWAVRVQLVDKPGYMVNYGLGAVITADIRQRVAEQLGPFEAGDPRWYGWISQHLLSSGEELQTAQLLRQFLGRPVSPQALLAALGRMSAVRVH